MAVFAASLLLWPVMAALLLLWCPMIVAADIAAGRREVVEARKAAVATDDGRCSVVGRQILEEGGNAVDAAVAASLCLGVVSPASSGIGGGAFMLLRLATGKTQAFDFRETAPSLASKNMYANKPSSKSSGPLSIAVPSELAGLYKAWKHHGKVPWKKLVNPAAKLARRGFRVSPYLHMQMVRTQAGILKDRGLSRVFSSNGSLLQIGDVCRNKKLARTLEAVSRYGAKAMYKGGIGVDLVKDVEESGGILRMEDLQGYKVKVREAVSAEVMGYEVLGMPPPSSGGAGMILILNILASYGIPRGIMGSLGLHREIEALKHMLGVRMNLGDPDFTDISKVVSDMLSPKFAQELKSTILDNMTFSPNHYGGRWNQVQDHGTSHLCVVDSDRNVVSMTSTINSYFGAQFLSPRTGIVLNNEMDDFSVPTVGVRPPPVAANVVVNANYITPAKRPLSSMSPTIVLKDGQLKAVLGASGGAMIIAGTTEVFLNHFAKGMDPFSSVMAPRSYPQLVPNVVMYENWTTVSGDHFQVEAEMREALEKKGHVLQPLAGGTICQFIGHNLETSSAKVAKGVIYGELTAVSDPRKGGFPAGF